LLSSYAVFVAGNSSGVFTEIKMDSTGIFLESIPDSSEIHSFGAQVIEIIDEKAWVGGSIRYPGMASGFCPLILKTDINLAQEFAFTTDCSSKSIFYSVE